MKKILFAMFSLALIVSCGPSSYTILVEKQADRGDKIDFKDDLIGVMVLSDTLHKDSLFFSAIGIGFSERLESELGREEGAIPLYPVRSAEVALDKEGEITYLRNVTGGDYLFLIDSLAFGQWEVYKEGFDYQSIVRLPVEVRARLYGEESEKVLKASIHRDTCQWVIISGGEIPEMKAVSHAINKLPETMKSVGEAMAAAFVPEWNVMEKRIYVYNSTRWQDAYLHAYLFEWEKAMEIWMKEAENGGDPMKAGYASYNLSVACEILGMEELAAEWKERANRLLNRN